MTTVVSTTRDAEVAVIAVNNPPVNALSQAVRAGLREAVGQADADASVRAVVILCRGRTFIAGADVTEFDRAPQPPHLPELAQCIADVRKPEVAALHGTAAGGAPRRTGLLAAMAADPAVFAEADQRVAKKQRALVAPRACVEALRTAATLPLAEGLARERELFLELLATPQAAALRHAFLGEREVGKIPDLPAQVSLRQIEQAAVVGAGTMGGGIAMCFANAGIPVRLLQAQAGKLAQGLEALSRNYWATVARGGLTQAQADERLALIRPTLAYQDLAHADLIVEAVFEDIAVKEQVFRQLDQVAKAGAILATNTSYLHVGTIAEFTRRPQDVVGMHFFSPAHVMKLLENVRAPKTQPDVLATVRKLGKRLGKVAALVGGAAGV